MRVADYWSTDDVLSLDDSLSDREAQAALLLATYEGFDASIGVNWDTLEIAIDCIRDDPSRVDQLIAAYGDNLEEDA